MCSDVNHGFVRVRVSVLREIRFHHVRSVVDVSLAATGDAAHGLPYDAVCGHTEWLASAFEPALSIAWDWAVVRSLIVVLKPANIRTNAQLIGEHGEFESPLRTRIYLLEHLEVLPWRQVVLRLVRGMPGTEALRLPS